MCCKTIKGKLIKGNLTLNSLLHFTYLQSEFPNIDKQVDKSQYQTIKIITSASLGQTNSQIMAGGLNDYYHHGHTITRQKVLSIFVKTYNTPDICLIEYLMYVS